MDSFFADNHGIKWSGKDSALASLHLPSSKQKLILKKSASVNLKNTKHLFLEGDNLQILNILLKKYKGKVKTVYIDPPYNTMKDRLYDDKKSHSNWLSMIYPRLHFARELLSDNGMIFVSIGLDESHHLRIILDDLFGENNLISEVVWHSKYTTANDKKFISMQHEYIMIYAKNKDKSDLNLLPRTEKADRAYKNPDNDPRGKWKPTPIHAKSGSKNIKYTFTKIRKFNGELIKPFVWSSPKGRYPRYCKTTLEKLESENRITCGRNGTGVPNAKTFLNEVKNGIVAGSLWRHEDVGHTHEANEELSSLIGKGIFDNPKPVKLIKRILQLSTSPKNNDIVLDFYAGSGTTAHAVLEQNKEDNGNRKFICIQENIVINRGIYHTISDAAKCRIKKAIKSINKENITNNKTLDCGFKNYELKNS